LTDDGPIAPGAGHDFRRLVDARVPGLAAVGDDIVEGFEDAVREPVLPHKLPDMLLAVEFEGEAITLVAGPSRERSVRGQVTIAVGAACSGLTMQRCGGTALDRA